MKKRAKADSTSTGADEGWAVLTTLIGGFVVWGAIGWGLDRWWGTSFLTPVGLIVGMALGIYAVVARHGGFKPSQPAGARSSQYNPHLYRANPDQHRSSQDPRPGPPPADTRRETECP
jgi:F0F1-type ATP synthase assembly protein I